MLDECGSEIPAAAEAYIVNPEQSKESGPAPPQTSGLPCWASAVSTAICAAWVGAATGAAVTVVVVPVFARAGSGLSVTPAAVSSTKAARRTGRRERPDRASRPTVDVRVLVMDDGSPVLIAAYRVSCRVRAGNAPGATGAQSGRASPQYCGGSPVRAERLLGPGSAAPGRVSHGTRRWGPTGRDDRRWHPATGAEKRLAVTPDSESR